MIGRPIFYALTGALLLGGAALAEEQKNSAVRSPVLRAPTQGKTVSTILPLETHDAAVSELLYAPAPEAPAVKSSSKRKSNCITTSSIRAADVRDDSTIRLTLGKHKQVDMKLYGICPGLAFDESFYYQPGPTMELCARLDTIVARSGSRCLIDAFVPVEPGSKK
jgi:hypothetical protein